MSKLPVLKIGHSPDTDDAFMFYALTNRKLKPRNFTMKFYLEEIEQLNRKAFECIYDVTAASVHAYAYLSDKYQIIPFGSSIGLNYGPVIVAKDNIPLERLRKLKICIPGTLTTAYLLLKLCLPETEVYSMNSKEIIPAILNGKFPAGLIIHEGQLTYEKYKLCKILDFGKWWFEKFNLPLPLGLNLIRKDLDEPIKKEFINIFLDSINYALKNRKEALRFAKKFSEELNDNEADRFVDMYVNNYSLNLTDKELYAIEKLLSLGKENGLITTTFKVQCA